jgi:hypothetical protein
VPLQTHIPFLEARERSRFLKLFWTEKERSFRTRRYPRSDSIWGRRRLSISNMYLLNAAVYPDEGRSVLEVELETSNTRPCHYIKCRVNHSTAGGAVCEKPGSV